MYYIEKNIPLPTVSKKPKGPLRLAMEKMEVGDSILIESNKQASSYITAKGAGIKIKTIFEGDRCHRIWRIK